LSSLDGTFPLAPWPAPLWWGGDLDDYDYNYGHSRNIYEFV